MCMCNSAVYSTIKMTLLACGLAVCFLLLTVKTVKQANSCDLRTACQEYLLSHGCHFVTWLSHATKYAYDTGLLLLIPIGYLKVVHFLFFLRAGLREGIKKQFYRHQLYLYPPLCMSSLAFDLLQALYLGTRDLASYIAGFSWQASLTIQSYFEANRQVIAA